MRAFVTGASGFAGRHLIDALHASGHDVVELEGDVLEAQDVRTQIERAAPGVVFHLAAQAFVPAAIADPQQAYAVNVIGTANVLAAVRALEQPARLLFTSSAEVYGAQPQDAMPLRESTAPNPGNPYAASKAAAEALVLGEVRSFGTRAIIARAFNHIGPGQHPDFVAPAFAAQLAAIARGASAQMSVGNLSARRDFLDVRDVVAAYVALAEHGVPGAAYNVCSGGAVSIQQLLGELIRIARVPVEVREDPKRMRPSDVPLLYGSNAKLTSATGWQPRIPLQRSLQDVYADALRNAA